MLPCAGCCYRESIPGDAHIRCVFLWRPQEVFVAPTRRVAQWFLFPFNYDPLWGPDECPNRSDGPRDAAKVAPSNPMSDILSLLGGRRL
mgnify:FL=1